MGGMGSWVLDTSGWDDCHEARQQSEDFFKTNVVVVVVVVVAVVVVGVVVVVVCECVCVRVLIVCFFARGCLYVFVHAHARS